MNMNKKYKLSGVSFMFKTQNCLTCKAKKLSFKKFALRELQMSFRGREYVKRMTILTSNMNIFSSKDHLQTWVKFFSRNVPYDILNFPTS